MRLPTVLTACTLATSVAAPLAAEPPEGEKLDIVSGAAPMLSVRETRFRFLDLDSDGFISRDEVKDDDNVLQSQFGSLDADGDGRLSEQEYVLSHRKAIE